MMVIKMSCNYSPKECRIMVIYDKMVLKTSSVLLSQPSKDNE